MTIKIPTLRILAAALEVRADAELPKGVCGIVTGIALRYNVVDSYQSKFRAGSLDKTRAKVAAGKVKLFNNHGAGDSYGTRTHIGTVKSLVQAGDAEVMTAWILDTEDGRRANEYLVACTASGAETGLSIGFFERDGEWEQIGEDKYGAYVHTEIELEEISLAPRNAVPGAEVTGVRNAPPTNDVRNVLKGIRAMLGGDSFLALVRELDSNATDGDEPGADSETRIAVPAGTATPPETPDAGDEPAGHRSAPVHVSMAERLKALRSTFTVAPRG